MLDGIDISCSVVSPDIRFSGRWLPVSHCQNCPHLLCYVSFSDSPNSKAPVHSDSSHIDSEPHKRRNQILSVLFAFGAMLGYAILTGIVSIEHVRQQGALEGPSHGDEEEEDEEED